MGQVHGQRKRRRIVVGRHKVEQVGLVCFIDDADGGIGRLQELIYDTAGIISLGSGTKWNVLKKANICAFEKLLFAFRIGIWKIFPEQQIRHDQIEIFFHDGKILKIVNHAVGGASEYQIQLIVYQQLQ